MPSLFDEYRATQPPPFSEETRRMRLRLEASLERRASRRRWALGAGAVAAVVVMLIGARVAFSPAPESPRFLVAAPHAPVQVPLPASGQLELELGARAQVATGVGADVELLEGAVTLRVQRAVGARWVVHVDGYTVEALGTRFRVLKTGGQPEVFVSEGVVRVRGPGLPDEGVKVSASTPQVAEPLAPSPSVVAEPAPPATPTNAPVGLTEARWLPRFRSLLQSGDLEAAVRLIPSSFPAERGAATAKDLLDAGDLFAAAGAHARAELSYTQVCRVAKGEGACGLAQVRMAIARGNAGDIDGALSWAQRYLSANPSGVFAPEMAGRRMSWLVARGRVADAREAAQNVLEHWPDSTPWAAQARALLKAP
jgi:hypothetical protein